MTPPTGNGSPNQGGPNNGNPGPSNPNQFVEIEYKQPNNPFARYPPVRANHSICANERHLFVFGGGCNGFNFTDLWSFELATQKWSKLMDCSALNAADHFEVFMWRDQILLYGGSNLHTRYLSRIDPYYAKPLVQPMLTTGRQPFTENHESVALMNDHLYVVGEPSLDGAENGYVVRLDLQTLRWEWLCGRYSPNSMPKVGDWHQIAMDEENIYLLGGIDRTRALPLMDLWVYNVPTSQWRLAETAPHRTVSRETGARDFSWPKQRWDYSCTGHVNNDGDHVAIISGGTDKACHEITDIWSLTLRNLTWEKLPAMLPDPLHAHASTSDGHGSMYVFGGVALRPLQQHTDNLYRLWTSPKGAELDELRNENTEHD